MTSLDGCDVKYQLLYKKPKHISCMTYLTSGVHVK